MIEIYLYNEGYRRLYFCEFGTITYHDIEYNRLHNNSYQLTTDRYEMLLRWFDYMKKQRRTIRVSVDRKDIKNPTREIFEQYLFTEFLKC